MKKKLSRIIIAMMIAMLLVPTTGYSFGEVETQQSQETQMTEESADDSVEGTVDESDSTKADPDDASVEKDQKNQQNDTTQKTTQPSSEVNKTGKSSEDDSKTGISDEEMTEEMEFLYIESDELTAPGTQNIVVSWDSSLDEVSDIRLIYQTPSGQEANIKESKRTDQSILFTKDFNTSETGTYKIKGVKYSIDDEECYFAFDDVEIAATFNVIADSSELENVVNVEVNENGSINKKEISNDISAAMAAAGTSTPSKARSAKSGNVVVVLDPGHGGSDPGATSNGLNEDTLNLKIANYCKAELQQYSGVTVYMTRSTDKKVELAARVDYAESKGADLFVSIHINAGRGTGAEVYCPNNNYKPSIGAEGRDVATKIAKQLEALGLKNRGVKTKNSQNNTKYPNGSLADYYGVIRMSKLAGFPGIIVEHAFIDNAKDAAFLKSEANLKKLGIADATGIAQYFGLEKGKWVQDEKGWKYQKSNGEYYIDCLATIGGEKYYFDENGYRFSGFVEVDGTLYYFDEETGKAPTSKWYTVDGEKYYTDRFNKVVRGLVTIGGEKYYFNEETGAMETGWHTVNGEELFFGEDGKLVEEKHTISGKSRTDITQMVKYYDSSGKKFPAYYRRNGVANIEEFCKIYYEEAEAEGIRAEVAFCQAMKETGWLQFGGDVDISQFNFAGIGAVGGGASGASFKNVRTGVRAQIQHLKAYANKEKLVNDCVDPRFNLVTRGSAPYVEWLGAAANPNGTGWAPSADYGSSIVKMVSKLLEY